MTRQWQNIETKTSESEKLYIMHYHLLVENLTINWDIFQVKSEITF